MCVDDAYVHAKRNDKDVPWNSRSDSHGDLVHDLYKKALNQSKTCGG